jgi:glucose-6-phosphate dehydrogenase assembly protein OpcA
MAHTKPNILSSDQPGRLAFFNLVVYLPRSGRRSAVHTIVENITTKLPARTIVITHKEDNTEGLEVRTIPHLLQHGATRIAAEEISIEASPSELAKVPFTVMPYLLPDLPIYLLWDQNPLEDKTILPHLEPFATRLIFNADASDDWRIFSSSLLQNVATRPLEIMDVNWASIGTWRDAFVRLFHTNATIEQLKGCKQLYLTHSGTHKADTTQSLYLCSWLAAQLDWSLEKLQNSKNGMQATYKHSSGSVVVHFQGIACDAHFAGEVLSIKIATADDTSYTLKRHPHNSTVTVHIGREDTCDLPFTLPLPTLVRSLTYMKELFLYTSGSHYPNMLRQLASFSQ